MRMCNKKNHKQTHKHTTSYWKYKSLSGLHKTGISSSCTYITVAFAFSKLFSHVTNVIQNFLKERNVNKIHKQQKIQANVVGY